MTTVPMTKAAMTTAPMTTVTLAKTGSRATGSAMAGGQASITVLLRSLLLSLPVVATPMMLAPLGGAGSLGVSIVACACLWGAAYGVYRRDATALGLVILPTLLLTWGVYQVSDAACVALGALGMVVGILAHVAHHMARPGTQPRPLATTLDALEPLQEWLWPTQSIVYVEPERLAFPPPCAPAAFDTAGLADESIETSHQRFVTLSKTAMAA